MEKAYTVLNHIITVLGVLVILTIVYGGTHQDKAGLTVVRAFTILSGVFTFTEIARAILASMMGKSIIVHIVEAIIGMIGAILYGIAWCMLQNTDST